MISASNYPEILVSDLMNMANGEHGLQTEYGKTASLRVSEPLTVRPVRPGLFLLTN